MKKHKITATLYYVAAILSYISAVINFAGENSNYMCVRQVKSDAKGHPKS